MNPFAVIAVIAAVGKAYATYQQGMAQKAAYDAKADQSRLKFKAERIEHKEKGVAVLKKNNTELGTIIAKAAAGGVLTNDGSNLVAQVTHVKSGVEDFNMATLNQEITQNIGLIEFNNLKKAGKQAAKAGIMNAIFGLGTDIGTIGTTGGFDATPKTTPSSWPTIVGSGGNTAEPYTG